MFLRIEPIGPITDSCLLERRRFRRSPTVRRFAWWRSLCAYSFQSNLAKSEKYRADIDGLRAIAVLPVVFFHTKIPGFSGGFVGVDIFYVISGYLITSLVAKDIAQGKFSLISFYDRRIRRIFPALFGVVFFCVVAAAVMLTPGISSPLAKPCWP